MTSSESSARALAEELGGRLRQARLNANLSQAELASRAGVSRNAVTGAEKGKVQLESMMAIMAALGLAKQLDTFLPPQPVSPLQLLKLQGKQRARASRKSGVKAKPDESAEW